MIAFEHCKMSFKESHLRISKYLAIRQGVFAYPQWRAEPGPYY